jgi:NADH dehydrogenase
MVRAAVRRPDEALFLKPLGEIGQITPIAANLRHEGSVEAAVAGADAVVNLVGLLYQRGRQRFDAIHVEGAGRAAAAARQAGASRFIQISAIGADPASAAAYARTKAAGEAAVKAAFPAATVLRPSIVFGPEDQFFNRFAAMARISPFLPLIGGGKTRFQPVFVGDVAAAVAASLAGKAKRGTVYELGGPEVLTFREILDLTQEWSGRARAYLPLPFWLAKLQAALTWPLPNSLRPITFDQVRLLQHDTVVSETAKSERRTLQGLGLTAPHGVGAIVPTYLERFRPRGQFAHYRT